MKFSSISPLFLASVCSFGSIASAFADDEEWIVTLKQRNLETGSVYYATVDREGNAPSQAPVPEGGSEFTLWAYSGNGNGIGQNAVEYLVDSTFVGAYLPEGKLWITTPDPYSGGIPRTRIDQGYTLNFEIDGLRTDDGAPDAAKMLLLDHNLAIVEGGDPIEGILGEQFDFEQRYLERNGVGSIRFDASNIPGTDVYNDAGMEYFSLFALPDGQTAEIQLSEAQVQVWPLSEAKFGGLEGASSFTIVPQMEVELSNLYPDSETWVQVYQGPESVGTNGARLAESVAIVNDVKPSDKVLTFKKLNEVLSENGQWTLEVLTETPFGIERIAWTTIVINRNLELRGQFQALPESDSGSGSTVPASTPSTPSVAAPTGSTGP